MTVDVIKVSASQLVDDRDELLGELRMSEDELRRRVVSEVATSEERSALERLGEIAFLLGEDE